MISVLTNLSTWLKCTKSKNNKVQKLTLVKIENLATKDIKSVVKNLMMKMPA